jgi:hypothetical protein
MEAGRLAVTDVLEHAEATVKVSVLNVIFGSVPFGQNPVPVAVIWFVE